MMHCEGNKRLLQLGKTAFVCSRRCPASVVLKSYDWAKSMRDQGECVVCGNHSQIEKDVVHFLLKGSQPLIIALARGLKKRLEPEIKEATSSNRLLLATPFDTGVTRVTQVTANQRNEMMAQLADEIFVAYAHPGGNLEKQVFRWLQSGKSVTSFAVEENRKLMDAGVRCVD